MAKSRSKIAKSVSVDQVYLRIAGRKGFFDFSFLYRLVLVHNTHQKSSGLKVETGTGVLVWSRVDKAKNCHHGLSVVAIEMEQKSGRVSDGLGLIVTGLRVFSPEDGPGRLFALGRMRN
jgi:hypothetical protein